MNTKIITFTLCLTCFLFGQTVTAQTANKKTTATAPKHYPNPYETPDPKKPLDKSPFEWDDYPSNITTAEEMHEAHSNALKVYDGYKILQLTRVEYYHFEPDRNDIFGNDKDTLNANLMLLEAFNIAVYNKDPYLAFYITEFNANENFSSSISSLKDMLSKTLDIALERKEVKILNKLANLEDRVDLID